MGRWSEGGLPLEVQCFAAPGVAYHPGVTVSQAIDAVLFPRSEAVWSIIAVGAVICALRVAEVIELPLLAIIVVSWLCGGACHLMFTRLRDSLLSPPPS